MLENREKIASQLLRLDQSMYLPISSKPHASTLPPDERAQGIAKMSTGLGINLSAKEDDAAAKIHVRGVLP